MSETVCPPLLTDLTNHWSDPIIIENRVARLDLIGDGHNEKLEPNSHGPSSNWNLLDKNQFRTIVLCLNGEPVANPPSLAPSKPITIYFEDVQNGSGSPAGRMVIRRRGNGPTVSIRCPRRGKSALLWERVDASPQARGGIRARHPHQYRILSVKYHGANGKRHHFKFPANATKVVVAIYVERNRI